MLPGWGPVGGVASGMSAARLGPSAHADHYTCNLPACDPLLPTLLLGPSHGDWFSQMALSVIQGVLALSVAEPVEREGGRVQSTPFPSCGFYFFTVESR